MCVKLPRRENHLAFHSVERQHNIWHGMSMGDLPRMSVFGKGCGTCSPKQWSLYMWEQVIPLPRKESSSCGWSAVEHSWHELQRQLQWWEARKSGQAFRKEEQKKQEQDALSALIAQSVSPAGSFHASLNATLACALVTVSVWFCTQTFWAAVHDKLDGAWFKSADFSSLLTKSRMSPCALGVLSMKGAADIGC